MPSSGSIDGLGIQIAYLEITKARAAGRGFINLVTMLTKLVTDATDVSEGRASVFTRTHIFTRIQVLQGRASRAFERGSDITTEEETEP